MTSVRLNAEEKRWRAQEDARTLAEAENIKLDDKRMSAAKDAAKRIAEEEMDRAKAMNKVASGKLAGTGTTKKKTTSKQKPKNTHNVFKKV